MDADAVLHPRGPLPPGVYWRRRLLTLLGVVLVLFLGARACGSDGSPKAGLSPSPSPRASRTPSHRPSSPATGSASPSVSASPSASGAARPCRAADLVLSAKADKSAYPPGGHPVLTIGIANKGRTPCTRDVGQAAREIRVMSGNDRVWSSDDCSPGGGAVVVTLQPGAAPTSFSVTWSRKRSAPGCPSGTRDVPAGTYRVFGRFGDLTSDPDTFTLG
jgi:hypothetical protein